MAFRSRTKISLVIALAVATAVAAPIDTQAQQMTDPVSVEGNVVTLADDTEVTFDQAALDALNAALANPDAPDAAQRLQNALTEVSAGDGVRLAAAAAYAASQQPTLGSAIALAAIRASLTPENATLVVANVSNVPGVEPNRVAAAIDAATDLSEIYRQAALDGLVVGQTVAGGPPDPLPTLPQQALAGQAIDTTENPAQDNVSPVQ